MSESIQIDAKLAGDIIAALRRGTVPETGLQHFVVGLDLERQVIGEELDRAAGGRGETKFIRGDYGAGKSFLARLVMEAARERGFVVSLVTVSVDTPLHKMEIIYRDLCANLQVLGQQAALKGLIDRWIYRIEEKLIEVEGIGEDDPELRDRTRTEIERTLSQLPGLPSAFVAAVTAYHAAQYEGDFPVANGILGWLAGETTVGAAIKRQAGVSGTVDGTMGLAFVRGLAEVTRLSGGTGLMVVFDEVETVQRLDGPSREKALNNLRQLIDACDGGEFPYCYFLFTGTPDLFEGSKGIRSLKPLHDRIRVEEGVAFTNPRQPQILLPKFDRAKLIRVAERVRDIYAIWKPDLELARASDACIEALADRVTAKFGGRVDVVPRLFLREWLNVLDLIQMHASYDPMEQYRFDLESARQGVGLAPQEQEAVEVVL